MIEPIKNPTRTDRHRILQIEVLGDKSVGDKNCEESCTPIKPQEPIPPKDCGIKLNIKV